MWKENHGKRNRIKFGENVIEYRNMKIAAPVYTLFPHILCKCTGLCRLPAFPKVKQAEEQEDDVRNKTRECLVDQ